MALDVEALYASQASNLRGFVVNRLGTSDDDRIDDLLATVWARAWEKRHQYRDQGYDPKSWIFRIAHNAIVDDIRRAGIRRRLTRVPLTDVDAYTATVDAGSHDHIELISARSDVTSLLALDSLTDLQRRIIECRFLLGLSEKETCVATGHSYTGVKKLQYRALENIRKHLGIAA